MYQGGSEPRVDSLHPPWSGGRAGPIAWPAGMEPWRRRQRARLPGALPQNALNNTVPSTRTRAAAPTPRHARTQRSRPASPHLGYPQSRPLQLCRVRPWSPHAGTPASRRPSCWPTPIPAPAPTACGLAQAPCPAVRLRSRPPTRARGRRALRARAASLLPDPACRSHRAPPGTGGRRTRPRAACARYRRSLAGARGIPAAHRTRCRAASRANAYAAGKTRGRPRTRTGRPRAVDSTP